MTTKSQKIAINRADFRVVELFMRFFYRNDKNVESKEKKKNREKALAGTEPFPYMRREMKESSI